MCYFCFIFIISSNEPKYIKWEKSVIIVKWQVLSFLAVFVHYVTIVTLSDSLSTYLPISDLAQLDGNFIKFL